MGPSRLRLIRQPIARSSFSYGGRVFMTEAQATILLEAVQRIEFLTHAAAITLGLMFGVMCWNVVRHAMDRGNL